MMVTHGLKQYSSPVFCKSENEVGGTVENNNMPTLSLDDIKYSII